MTAEAPLISVAMPAFNASATIGEAMDSALAQTHGHVEVVICDDGSTDTTRSVVQAIGDERIRLICNDTNRGVGAARNNAMAAARGEWIALLDADDTWQPERLETLLKAATRHASDVMIFDDILICHHAKKGMQPWRRLRGPGAFGSQHGRPVDVAPAAWARSRRFLMQPLIPAAMFRSLNVHHGSLPFGEDTEFVLRLLAAGMKLRYVPGALYNYRITPGSISASTQRARLMRDMLENILPLFEGNPVMQAALQRKINYRDFTMAIKSGRIVDALGLALRQPTLASELAARGTTHAAYHLHHMRYLAENQNRRHDNHT